ncbi:DUF664 domain-containing protein [Nocardiopsis sp. SBT366]|uniref:mycothiol transferase n=1 Tax=Nocardiopsis sp. SBT366 TaxID=1580529 RepID=UPI001F31A761|nr:DUF664 domain-containing protein [Nocardiopsis sp. SBT366]
MRRRSSPDSWLRESALTKVEGAPEEHVRAPGVASGTHLLGLIAHLTRVERRGFLGEENVDWAATFRAGPDRTTEEVLQGYRDAVAAANRAIAACEASADPRTTASGAVPGHRCGRRWRT